MITEGRRESARPVPIVRDGRQVSRDDLKLRPVDGLSDEIVSGYKTSGFIPKDKAIAVLIISSKSRKSYSLVSALILRSNSTKY